MRWLLLLAVLWMTAVTVEASAMDVPVPRSAEQVTKKDVDVNQMRVHVTAFQTADTPQAVIAFYRERLTKDGWTVEEVPGLQEALPASGMVQVLTLRQGDHRLVVNAQRLAGQDKTMVSVNVWSLDTRAMEQQLSLSQTTAAISMPQWMQEDSGAYEQLGDILGVPAYPGATRDFGMRDPALDDFQMAGYVTPDSVEEIRAFYEERMPLHSWRPATARTERLVEQLKVQMRMVEGDILVFETSQQLAMIVLRREPGDSGTAIDVMVSKHPRRALTEAQHNASLR